MSLLLKLKALVWARLQTGSIVRFREFSLKRNLLTWVWFLFAQNWGTSPKRQLEKKPGEFSTVLA